MNAQGRRHIASSRARRASSTNFRPRPGVKRSFDVLAALTLLAAVLPLLVLIAAAIKLDSRGPVFYRVRRAGFRGQPLLMLKFRKMRDGAAGKPLTASDDARLTRIGRGLARTRLDELPQLWEVLRGRMSIVGPRPEDPRFVALHGEAYDQVLSVRPGMTGLSQLAFAEEHKILNADDLIGDYVKRILPQKVGLDTLYADSYGLGMDLAVLRWTVVAVVLRRPIAVNRSTGRLNVRKRPRPAALPEAALSR
jgi:lipopolysaccharide/colanic/teichoic acid biosynthesis glycosyltransferase